MVSKDGCRIVKPLLVMQQFEPLMRGKNIQLQKIIERFLKENGPSTTDSIRVHVNNNTRHGTSANVLGNLLSKKPQFKKVGFHNTRSDGHSGSGTRNVIWDLIK